MSGSAICCKGGAGRLPCPAYRHRDMPNLSDLGVARFATARFGQRHEGRLPRPGVSGRCRFRKRVRITNKMYILGTDPARYTPFYDKLKNDPGWTVHTLPCSHFNRECCTQAQWSTAGPVANDRN
jgi:hypothetical protein